MVHDDALALAELALQQTARQLVLDAPLDRAAQGARAEGRIVALVHERLARRPRERDGDAALGQPPPRLGRQHLHDAGQLRPRERLEHDRLVDAVQELRAEALAQGALHRFPQLRARAAVLAAPREAEREALLRARAQVAGHDDDRVAEVHRAPVAVREPPVVQDLQQRVEDVGMRLLDLVEQDDAVGAAAHALGEAAALVVAHVARRRARQAADRVALLVLGHVQPDHGLLVVEEALRERLGQLRLAHARGAEKDEGADGAARILEARAGAAHGPGEGGDGAVLPDHALVQQVLEAQQLLALALPEAGHGDARHLAHERGDVRLAHAPALRVARLLPLDDALAGGLVDEVDGLVRQVALGQVARREAHRGIEGVVADGHAVVVLVAGAQAAQDGQRVLRRGLLHVDGGEAPLERRILLDAAVLVERGGPDGAQLAAREGGLHEVARVDGALRAARPDDRVQLVDEEDDAAVAGAHLLHDGLEALLEFAAELGPREERPHVERAQRLVAQAIGHVAVGDALGEALHDGGLAHARLADDDRVVLGAAVQDLHEAAHLGLAPDDRVQPALPRQPREVHAVALEALVAAFGGGAGDAGAAADFTQGAVDGLLVHAQPGQQAGGPALLVVGDGDEQVLDAHVLVREAVGLGVRRLQHPHHLGRGVDLDDLLAQARLAVELGRGEVAQGGAGRAQALQHLLREAALQLGQRQQHVRHRPLAVAAFAHGLLGGRQHLLGLLRETVLSHHGHGKSPPAPRARGLAVGGTDGGASARAAPRCPRRARAGACGAGAPARRASRPAPRAARAAGRSCAAPPPRPPGSRPARR